MNNSKYVNFFFSWLLLRVYESLFFILLYSTFIWLIEPETVSLTSLKGIIEGFKVPVVIWVIFSIMDFYWLVSLLVMGVLFLKVRNLSFSVINAFTFIFYSIIIDLAFVFSPSSESLILGFFPVWMGVSIFNYFSPRFLRRSIKHSFGG